MSAGASTNVSAPLRPGLKIKSSGFPITFLVTLVATMIMSATNLLDPMIRWDDYPALFGNDELFWSKTLHEGRWLNYVWHLREWLAPAWANFAIYQLFWAGFGAATATLVIKDDSQRLIRFALAIGIVASPSAVLISLWFNTLIPGLGLVALYAVLACYLSARQVVWLLPAFVVVTFTAYTTYPLLLLAVCLIRQDKRSLPRLIGLLALFTASIVAAVLLTYTLNWYVHGIFGVPLDDWRAATHASEVGGVLGNSLKLVSAGQSIITAMSFDFLPFTLIHIAMFVGAAVVLAMHAPMLALYIYAGLFTGLVMVGAQVLQVGVDVPARAFIYVWVFHWIAVACAVSIILSQTESAGRIVLKLMIFVVGFQLMVNFQHYMKYQPWQTETSQIGQWIAAGDGPVFVINSPSQTPVGLQANIQSDLALFFRLQQVAGQDVTVCSVTPDVCAHLQNVPTAQGGIAIVELSDGQGRAIIYPAHSQDG